MILHKGLLQLVARRPALARGRYLLHLSVSTTLGPDKNFKVLVSSVEEALKYGADGVSIHVNLGTDREPDMLKDCGAVARLCMEWGMPFLAMVYPQKPGNQSVQIAHAARLGQELGADIVKVPYPGSLEDAEMVLRGVQIPLVFAGGGKSDHPEEIFYMVRDALSVGAAGLAIGRNVFQHDHPKLFTYLLSRLVHGNWDVEQCVNKLLDLNGNDVSKEAEIFLSSTY